LLEENDGVETVCGIVNEIVKKASDVIYKKYLEQAAYGYAVQKAKEQILNIVAVSCIVHMQKELLLWFTLVIQC